jgi:hypothetical protein
MGRTQRKLFICNEFHVNSFLPINTQEKLPPSNLHNVVKQGEYFVCLVMVTSEKN